jgi:hypothetical protein
MSKTWYYPVTLPYLTKPELTIHDGMSNWNKTSYSTWPNVIKIYICNLQMLIIISKSACLSMAGQTYVSKARLSLP